MVDVDEHYDSRLAVAPGALKLFVEVAHEPPAVQGTSKLVVVSQVAQVFPISHDCAHVASNRGDADHLALAVPDRRDGQRHSYVLSVLTSPDGLKVGDSLAGPHPCQDGS